MMTDIDRIRETLSFIPVGGNHERWRVAAMIYSELGEAGRDLWDEWRGDRGNDDAASTWRSASKDGSLKIGTLFHEAKAAGWRDDGRYQKPTPEELAERRRMAAERAAKEEAEIARERADTAAKASAILKAATEAKADHPYLVRKQVSPVATLREIEASAAAAILGYAPKSGGDALAGRLLVVPVKQGDGISTVELIDEVGKKAALQGRGTKAGGYWATERLPDGDGAGLTLLVGEGVATVLSAAEATGHPAIAALSSGNLLAAVKTMRDRYPRATLAVLADLVKATGEPDPHAIEAARAVGGWLAVPDFGNDRPEAATDFNDLAVWHSIEAVAEAIRGATPPARGEPQADAVSEAVALPKAQQAEATDTETIRRLADLSPVEYDRTRRDEADKLGIRPGTLDKLVGQMRKANESAGIGFDDVEPWPHPVDPAALLSDLSETILRFIVCQPESADAAALWASMTWFMDAVQVAPLAVITAPEKRCGKSQLLFLLGKLTYRPLTASNITPSALFRSIDAWNPTLLVDEADAFMRENEELRGLLNCGHTRDSAYIIRTVGETFTPTRFNVWGAKALAGIGHLADTLMDRAITIELRRKLPHEAVDRLRHVEAGLFDDLAAKLARFADDYREQVRLARPALPDALNDRAQDNWEPLLAIANVAGSEWPERARKAALMLSGADASTMSIGTELLSDIQEIFATKRVSRITTADLIESLCADDEKPWATFNRGKPVAPRQIAKRLNEYGIKSKNLRIGYGVPKGFAIEQFQEAFDRYLHTPPPEQALQPLQTPEANNGAAFRVADIPLRSINKNPPATLEPAQILGCSVVADREVRV